MFYFKRNGMFVVKRPQLCFIVSLDGQPLLGEYSDIDVDGEDAQLAASEAVHLMAETQLQIVRLVEVLRAEKQVGKIKRNNTFCRSNVFLNELVQCARVYYRPLFSSAW